MQQQWVRWWVDEESFVECSKVLAPEQWVAGWDIMVQRQGWARPQRLTAQGQSIKWGQLQSLRSPCGVAPCPGRPPPAVPRAAQHSRQSARAAC